MWPKKRSRWLKIVYKVRKTEYLGRNHEDLIFFFNEAFTKFLHCTFNIRRRGEEKIVFFFFDIFVIANISQYLILQPYDFGLLSPLNRQGQSLKKLKQLPEGIMISISEVM